MALNQYTFERRVIYEEYTYVEADSLAEAKDKVQGGDHDDSELGDWYDYYDDDFELVEATGNDVDPLVKMVKDYGIPIQTDIWGNQDAPREYYEN